MEGEQEDTHIVQQAFLHGNFDRIPLTMARTYQQIHGIITFFPFHGLVKLDTARGYSGCRIQWNETSVATW